MGDLLIILWLPFTIAFMAVAFVVTLGATGGSVAVDQMRASRSETMNSPNGAP